MQNESDTAPQLPPEVDSQVRAIRTGAGALLRPEQLTLRVEGDDIIRFLNGMLSNDVSKLEVGQAQRAVKASAKGRVEGVLRVRRRASEVLIELREVVAARVAGELLKFIVMDDVRLSDGSGDRQVVSIHGPAAEEVLARAGFTDLPPRPLAFVEGPAGVVIRDDELGVHGFELHVPDASATLDALVAAGAVAVSDAAIEVVRVEAGQPIDGVDIDLDTLPLEARLDEAIDQQKGCYLGQEVIARATHRGGVRHRLVGLRFGLVPPPRGAELWPPDGEKAAGELTSSVFSPTVGGAIGLGYLRVEHEAPGTKVEARWDGGRAAGEVVPLPHVG